jgi:hypothetical protein
VSEVERGKIVDALVIAPVIVGRDECYALALDLGRFKLLRLHLDLFALPDFVALRMSKFSTSRVYLQDTLRERDIALLRF